MISPTRKAIAPSTLSSPADGQTSEEVFGDALEELRCLPRNGDGTYVWAARCLVHEDEVV